MWVIVPSFMEQNKNTFLTVDAREKAALSKTVAVHTVAHVTQIWGDRLQLISICVSRLPHG
jgi:hypothetical protein